jgi:DEAD/DEAH box helicase domain-containing protein
MRLLTAILEYADQLEKVDRVSDIDIHPLLKSELEKAFLEALRSVPAARLQPKVVKGKAGYVWRSPDAAWEIAPQVEIRFGSGMDVPSIPDFVLYPVRAGTSRPIAIFLDGFSFHADEAAGHNRVTRDVLQRQALVRSGKFWVWSFSWEDIQYRNDPSRIAATSTGESHADRRNGIATQVFTGDELTLAQSVAGYSSWTLLLHLLARPNPVFWTKLSYLYALALPRDLQQVGSETALDVVQKLCNAAGETPTLIARANSDGLAGIADIDDVAALTFVTNRSITERNPSGVFLLARFDDDTHTLEHEFSQRWRGFLRLTNRLQFLTSCYIATVRGCRGGMFAGINDAFRYFLADGGSASQETPTTEQSRAVSDSRDLNWAYLGLKSFLEQISAKNIEAPEIGYELETDGIIVAGAELAWRSYKVAVIREELTTDRDVFSQKGWSVFSFNETGLSSQDAAAILSILSSG